MMPHTSKPIECEKKLVRLLGDWPFPRLRAKEIVVTISGSQTQASNNQARTNDKKL